MRACHVPGVSVAVIERRQVVEQRAYGVTTAGDDALVTETTRFQACSISKPVTVLAMLRLVERGVLDLDADVNDTLRGWRVPANGGWQPRVTLRQLASHSAGLTTHGVPGYRRDVELPDLVQILTGTSPANTEGVRVDIIPGVQFRYSGGGTTVMQLLLEEVTQTPVADLIRTLVLDPLGMQHSVYEQPLPEAWTPRPRPPTRATDVPWRAAGTSTRSRARPVSGPLRPTWPASRSRSSRPCPVPTAPSSPRPWPRSCSPRRARRRPARNGSVASTRSASDSSCAGTTEPCTYFGHSGGNEGFRCHLLAHRDHGTGAAVMTNADGAMPVIIQAFDAIATARGWEGYQTEPLDDLPPSGPGLDGFTGSFVSDSGLHVEVTRDGDRIDVVVGDQAVVPFSAYQAKEIASQFVDATLTLSDDGLVLRQSGGEIVCRRVVG